MLFQLNLLHVDNQDSGNVFYAWFLFGNSTQQNFFHYVSIVSITRVMVYTSGSQSVAWSWDQQYQYCLGTWKKSKFLDSIPALLTQKLWRWSPVVYINKPFRWFQHKLKFENHCFKLLFTAVEIQVN